MPAHFTHIYTARRIADYLAAGQVPDWTGPAIQGNPQFTGTIGKYGPRYCGEIMKRWEKFTAVGAIGPDLFYFSQDYASKTLGTVVPPSDMIMLALAVYYFKKTNEGTGLGAHAADPGQRQLDARGPRAILDPARENLERLPGGLGQHDRAIC